MTASKEQSQVAELVRRAREAQRQFETYSQPQVDEVVIAAAWALIKPQNNARLSALAVEETGLGNVQDKVTKNHRKTLGLLRDLQSVRTVGVIGEDRARGLVEIGRPVGVVGVIVPSTNPVATPMNNTLNALKCRNAIILAPSPKGQPSCTRLLELIHAELDRVGAPRDLVQQLPAPVSKALSQEMLQQVDLVVATGSQNNVRAAYTSGTPAFGVGAGNVTVIVDETADLALAAERIRQSKTFDNATSCSSENSVIVVDAVYDAMLREFDRAGAALLNADEKQRLQAAMWHDGHLNREVLAKPVANLCRVAGLEREGLAQRAMLLVEETDVGPQAPFSGEKMSLVLTVYRARDYADAKRIATRILDFQGRGHSLGIHTRDPHRPEELGQEIPVCRIIVNQPHCFATGGSFDNGLPFSLSMGCGSWGGNITDENVHYKHYMNITRVVRTIAPREVSVDDIFGDYKKRYQL
ncbi:acylating sulfoacetaldehyde dehydrogenase [Marinobacterium rhizophilum]|uniref:Aldehyde dehydrogenase family protein n=1 Tax=Marinobacterium rhizophilum TaxID=420402 RepID=A0ABY5HGR0_9GAMM|nr:aldehyde dehydrogenase family protein [Marinobacterium rhizophilum]UTW11550.1 aldehyde dehydrogenase family protein [Marinobacterium rhizophilum]